eukprot:TRINITY_DN9663_c0_g1_i2.p1 TRINITY_DN9663_c0_g1~~TRINITY_DN9663_c0_g1_i2.p1  ORF type:complete len:113 (+),score=25.38 TRINITY_DN9663_c0_g1_i2:191-529(+)
MFSMRNPDGRQVEFQTTVKAAGNDKDKAEIVAQRCHAKASEGYSKDELLAYRKELYEQCWNGSLELPLESGFFGDRRLLNRGKQSQGALVGNRDESHSQSQCVHEVVDDLFW